MDDAAAEGAVGVVVPLLKKLNGGDMLAQEQPTTRWVSPPKCPAGWGGWRTDLTSSGVPTTPGPRRDPLVPTLNSWLTVAPLPCSARSGVEELERDICFILGLLAIKVEHQAAICEAGALPTLVSMIRRYAGKNDVNLAGVAAQTCRRTSDAITNLAHENNSIKNKVRQEGGIPPLVSLLHSADPKVQRAVAGSLRTLAFKNDENKNIIVDLGSLPLLIQMLRSNDTTIHYEVRRAWPSGTRRVPVSRQLLALPEAPVLRSSSCLCVSLPKRLLPGPTLPPPHPPPSGGGRHWQPGALVGTHQAAGAGGGRAAAGHQPALLHLHRLTARGGAAAGTVCHG